MSDLKIRSKSPLGLKWIYFACQFLTWKESLVYKPCTCTFRWADTMLPCSGIENVQQGSCITPLVPAHSLCLSCGLLMARRSKRVGGGGLRACGGQGRVRYLLQMG